MRTLVVICAILLTTTVAFALTPTNPGDLNNDNRVDVSDVFVVVNCLSQNAATCQSGRADPNNDGAVNIYDFIAVSKSWGQTYSTSPQQMLVAAYSFSEDGGTTAADSSGNGNTATLSGVVGVTGKNGVGALCTGTSSMTIPDSVSLDVTTGITIEAWVRPNAGGSLTSVVAKEGSGGSVYGLYASSSDNVPISYMTIGSNQGSATGSNALTINTFTHIATTYDGGTMRFYVNGVQTGSASISGTIATSNSPLRMCASSVTGQSLNAIIDDVRIYNYARTSAQIQTDMNTAVVLTSGPPAPDTTDPSIAFSVPANGATVSGAVTVTATASDNIGVSGVQFAVDGVNLGSEDTSSPFSVSWSTTGIGNGAHTLSAIARDAAGNTASASRTVTVSNAAPDTQDPTVSITAPASGATITTTTTITASASDNVGVASVQFLLDGANLGSADTSSPYSVSYNPASTPNGAHTISARATDTSGRAGTSVAVSITVTNPPDTTPPTATITAPSAGAVLSYGTTSTTLAVTTNEPATCKYSTSNTATYATMTLTMNGGGSTSHTISLSPLTNGGSYTYYVRCQDTALNAMTASQSRSFSVSSTLPPANSLYYNSAEPGCDGSDPNVLWCDDFEDGVWYAINCDDANNNGGLITQDGWCGTIYHDPITPPGAAICGNVGAEGTNCAATQGATNGDAGGRNLADHSIPSSNDVYVRYYTKPTAGYKFGAEKVLSFNKDPAGVGGIYYGNLHFNCGNGGTANSGELQWQPTTPSPLQVCQNIFTMTSGNWYYIEVHINVASDILQVWANDCGPNGQCTGSPTLRLNINNYVYNTGTVGSIWFENWASPGSIGERYIDQIKVSKIGPIGFVQ